MCNVMYVGLYQRVIALEGVCHISQSGLSFIGPTSFQLSFVPPQSCLHVVMAIPWAMALRGWLNQVRVANGPQTLGELGMCLS